MRLRNSFLASACFSPVDSGGPGGSTPGGDIPVDDLSEDVLAAYSELEGADDGDGDGGTEKLGDGRAAAREPTRKESVDGKQAKAKTEGADVDGKRRAEPAATQRPSDFRPGQDQQQQPAGPPPSFTPQSKAAWNAFREAFPAIAADIAKRETETAQGLAALRDFKDVAPYAQMAKESGTTLANALLRYTNLETLSRKNPVNGLIAVCQGLGLEQPDAASVCLRAAQLLGANVGSGDRNPEPRANGGGGADRNAPGADPFILAMRPLFQPMLDRMVAMEERLGTFAQADRNARERTLDSAIEAFATDPENVYFPDVEGDITRLFETGMVPLTGNHTADLKTAYGMAIRMNSQVSEALIERRLSERGGQRRSREQENADRARRASRSLAGSQSADIDPAAANRGKRRELKPGQKPVDDIADDVAAAYEQVAGNAAY